MPLIISGGVLGFIIVTALSVLPALVAYSACEVVTNAPFRFAMFSSSGEWLGSSASASAGHSALHAALFLAAYFGFAVSR
jgi:hypothetical protein